MVYQSQELRLFEEKWQELIMNQVNLSQNSKLILAHESSHSIHIDRPDSIVESVIWLKNE